MRSFFNFLTTTAIRFRVVTLIIVVIVMILGIIAATRLNQELLPPIELPQTIIFAPVSGMTSDEVLSTVTRRIEEEVSNISEIVNVESTTNGAFGALITAANDFGLNQTRLVNEIRESIDNVWFPTRRIEAPEGDDPAEFASALLGDLTAEQLLYLSDNDPNFLFQLAPEVWQLLSADAVQTLVEYMATNVDTHAGEKTALERLIEQEFIPQLDQAEAIARVVMSGGQALPGEEEAFEAIEVTGGNEVSDRLLLELSVDAWNAISGVLGIDTALDAAAVRSFENDDLAIPEEAPLLPESWQVDHFEDVTDLIEVSGGSAANVLNEFAETGRIAGALGKTNDLTPETVTQLLEIEPSLVQYLQAEHLSALSPDVFAVLPDDFIDGLDGFTRDELAASTLAQSITGTQAEPEPVTLPSAWRIQPPEIITFSFSDLPLASYSISTTGDIVPVEANTTEDAEESDSAVEAEDAEDGDETIAQAQIDENIPEGPALPALFSVAGELFGAELDTADDLLNIQLSGELAEQFGGAGSLTAAEFLNSMTLLGDLSAAGGTEGAEGFDPASLDLTQFLPALSECGIGLLDITGGDFDFAQAIIGCLDQDTVAFMIEHDPAFLDSLQPAVFDYFSDEVLELPGVAPVLGDVWNTLASRPEFAEIALQNADDVLALSGGSASDFLNTINENVPDRFAGYEVRLFDSLTPNIIGYFANNETDFFQNLDSDVLLKFSAEVLSSLPDEALESLDEETQVSIDAIANLEQPTAAEELAELYTSEVPPADPSAPALGQQWQLIAGFLGIEMNNAYDLFRFPDTTGTPSQFINGLFNSPGGANFAPDLLGSLSLEAFDYIAEQDPNFVGELSPQALTLLSTEVFDSLPSAIQESASAGEVFTPNASVNRTNGASSLLLTLYKSGDANTVEAFYAADEILQTIGDENDNIEVNLAFEQSSFIEDSISGVVSSGGLGALFAVLNILVFLSGGIWLRSGRTSVGIVLLVISVIAFAALIISNWENANGDLGRAIGGIDVIPLILLGVALVAGVFILIWPGRVAYPSWRPTLVIAVSIPLSIMSALAIMYWVPPIINSIFGSIDDSNFFSGLILRLFPENLTLNIMTLSGLTVAIGRLVDDSIVVLENVFRQMQSGMDKKEAILSGTKDVSTAIFFATTIAVVVFLPLGFTGGLIGEFFLPFGLAVTYTLLSSFLIAITVVPTLAYLFLNPKDVPEETESWMQRVYLPVLRWALSSTLTKWIVMGIVIVSLVLGFGMLVSRPFAFLPDFGEAQLQINVSLPSGTPILETNRLVETMEEFITETVPVDEIRTLQSVIGGSAGLESLILGGSAGVSQNVAQITLALQEPRLFDDPERNYEGIFETKAEEIFGAGNVETSVGSFSSEGFGGFELVVSADNQEVLASLDPQIIETLEGMDELSKVTSTLAQAGGTSEDGPVSFLRINRQPALSYTGELQTEDTINTARKAIQLIQAIPDLPDGITIGQGFDSELQTQGFVDLAAAMGIAIVIIVIILVFVFRSPVYWLALILSVIVAPVGAAIALTITGGSLSISAMIGLLMLIGLVITNAIVLIDRVRTNRQEQGMSVYDALIEAGSRRLRPILMTALATIIALIPLALGLSSGAIIAAELGIVVIGGVFSSTLLTLIVVPVAYSLLTPLHNWIVGLFRFGKSTQTES